MWHVLFGRDWASDVLMVLALSGLLVSLLGFLRLVIRPDKDTKPWGDF
jgi:O-antigen/teichoic acid export membrane protein